MSTHPRTDAPAGPSLRAVLIAGGAVCLVLAGIVSAWASSHPDGLEFVAERLGFAGSAGAHATGGSPLADYTVRGVGEGALSGGLAGVIGVLAVALVMGLLLFVLRRGRSRS